MGNEIIERQCVSLNRLGHPKGWYELGYLYESGQAGETSPQKAFNCYCKAMELGDEDATDKVRICYQEGIGTEMDLTKAKEIQKRYDKMKGL